MRVAWAPAAKASLMVTRLYVNGVRITVRKGTEQAWCALSYVRMAHKYHVRPGDTGAYNPRPITGGTDWSTHAYGIGLDEDWLTNPYSKKFITDMSPEMRRDVATIQTVDGLQVFRSGADWDGDPNTPERHYDAMHNEINVTPAELARGIDWSTVRMPAFDPAEPAWWPVCQRGDRHPAVKRLQTMLGIAADGIFGAATEAKVREFQASRKLKADGAVGAGTWTALLQRLPANPAISPVKLSATGGA